MAFEGVFTFFACEADFQRVTSGCLFQVVAQVEGAVQENFFIRRACLRIVHTGDDQVIVEFAAAVNKQ